MPVDRAMREEVAEDPRFATAIHRSGLAEGLLEQVDFEEPDPST